MDKNQLSCSLSVRWWWYGAGRELKKKKRKEGWTDRGTGAEHGALQQMQWGVKGFFTAGVSRPGGKRATEILLCMIKKQKCFSTFRRLVYDLEGGGGSATASWCVNVQSAKSPEEMRQRDEQRWEGGLVSRKCHQSPPPPPPHAVRHPAATNTQCKLYAFSTII